MYSRTPNKQKNQIYLELVGLLILTLISVLRNRGLFQKPGDSRPFFDIEVHGSVVVLESAFGRQSKLFLPVKTKYSIKNLFSEKQNVQRY